LLWRVLMVIWGVLLRLIIGVLLGHAVRAKEFEGGLLENR
jgi:uncharacterized protein YneF (UPF0154 family)